MAMKKKKAEVIEGNLGMYPLAEIISILHRDRATGILLARRDDEEKKVCFVDGQVVYASSTNKVEKLGYLLVEEGRITRDDLLAAAKDERDLHDFLVEEGKIDDEAYDRAMVGLIVDIVASAFDWSEGDFSFVDTEAVDIPGQVESVPMPDIFLEGVRCIESIERVEEGLGDASSTVRPGANAEVLRQEIHLEPVEDLVFGAIDGSRSRETIVSESMMGPDMTHRFLYALVLSGHLEIEGRRVTSLPRPTKQSRLAKERKAARRQVRKSVLQKKKKRRPKAAAGPGNAPPKPARTSMVTPSGFADVLEAGDEPPVEETLEERVLRLHGDREQKNFYELLGVEQGEDEDRIRRRYYELARDYHPDTLPPDAPDDLRKKLEELFGTFGEAYNVLRDRERRAEYDERLKAGAGIEEKSVDPTEAAKEAFEKGKQIMASDKAAAGRFFKYAAENHPERADYWFHMGVCMAGQSITRKEAEEALLKVLKLEPTNYMANYHLALLYKAGGLKTRAREMLREALRWDPENIKMQRLMAEMQDQDEKKGGLGGLFRKK